MSDSQCLAPQCRVVGEETVDASRDIGAHFGNRSRLIARGIALGILEIAREEIIFRSESPDVHQQARRARIFDKRGCLRQSSIRPQRDYRAGRRGDYIGGGT